MEYYIKIFDAWVRTRESRYDDMLDRLANEELLDS